jgi:glycosyltransferase involved in cell wall biosynthesis
MRVLHVINSLNYGGAETALVELVRHLSRRGDDCRPHVCTLFSGGELAPALAETGTDWINLDTPQPNATGPISFFANSLIKSDPTNSPLDGFLSRIPGLVHRLAQVIRRGDYDVVHGHLFPTFYILALASRLAQRPVYVYSEHSIFNRRRATRLFFPLERLVYDGFDQVVAVSRSVRNSLVQWMPHLDDRIETIVNGITIPDTDHRGPKAPDAPYLFVGSLRHYKGLDVLFSALQHLHQEGRLRRPLEIIGEGPDGARFRQLATEMGLDSMVRWLGQMERPQVFEHMNRAACLVLPSRWEGMPMVILEAMAQETPVVACDVGGVGELVIPGRTGLLVSPEKPLSLVEALNYVDEHPDQMTALGSHGRNLVKRRFDMADTEAGHYRLYRRLLARPRAVRGRPALRRGRQPVSATRPLRALHFLSTGNLAGTEVMTANLIQGLQQRNWQNDVLVWGRPGPIREKYRAFGLEPMFMGCGPNQFFRMGRLLLKQLRRGDYDVLHVYGFRSNFVARNLGRALRRGVLLSGLRSEKVSDRSSAWQEMILKFADLATFWMCDGYVSNSYFAAERLIKYGFPRHKMYVVHSGLQEEPFVEARSRIHRCRELTETSGRRPTVITCVAHLKTVKNHRLLLEAAHRLAETRNDFLVCLVGAGPRQAYISRLVRRYGLQDKIIMTGVRRDIPRILGLSDIFVLQSRWEGLPVSILEAMASGLPVVATRVGGIAELVADGRTGLLVPSGDVAALTSALARLLDDPDLRLRMGRAGHRRFRDHFEQQIMIDRMDFLYRRLVAKTGDQTTTNSRP